ncbi:metal-dependent hydrolase [Thalassolituus sp.]|jgi:predicted metal-dependent hydrolase|uniref:metal-dependent hydrolase n=1 Tax=Thalassolituus sp. TaxID=2030822 RepID=UPI002A820ED2|nr:metal-dependent hydrolase [Thalassolituus sp.]
MKKSAREISAEVTFPGRKMDFGFEFKDLPRYWNDNDPFKTHFMNALSCLFLEGERMFIDAVRDHQHLITDPRLQEQIKSFIKQEAIHGHEHHQFSKYLDSLGYPATKVEAFERKEKVWMKKWMPARRRLAITCAVEHFTAILAHQVLTNPEATEGMDPRFKEMWTWHAIEETEHKAVCFDAYEATGGKYFMRVFAMFNVTWMFLLRATIVQCIFLWKDGKLFSPSVWKSGFSFYWKKPGLIRSVWNDYKDYYRRDFHPWDHDNREELGKWQAGHENYKVV